MRIIKTNSIRRNQLNGRAEIEIEILEQFGNDVEKSGVRLDIDDFSQNNFSNLFNAETSSRPTNVIFNDPATIVYWNDGTKTVVKCDPRDTYSKEAGLAMCFMKKMCGSSRAFNNTLKRWTE